MKFNTKAILTGALTLAACGGIIAGPALMLENQSTVQADASTPSLSAASKFDTPNEFERVSSVLPVTVEADDDAKTNVADERVTIKSKPAPEPEPEPTPEPKPTPTPEPTKTAEPVKEAVLAAETPAVKQEAVQNSSPVTKKEAAPKKAAVKKAAPAAKKAAPAAKASPGSIKAYAQDKVASRGWSDSDYQCLVNLWNKESGWNYKAANPTSTARGIPQAMMSIHFGSNWQSSSAGLNYLNNPTVQVDWGLNYISGTHGTPCNAWAKSQSVGWY